ncbi:MAG: hypothetical protein ACTHMM_12060 [Agriterribacter sp.]
MKYFLLPDKESTNDFKIVKVQDQDIDSFLIRHQDEVIREGDSITEILLAFAGTLDCSNS